MYDPVLPFYRRAMNLALAALLQAMLVCALVAQFSLHGGNEDGTGQHVTVMNARSISADADTPAAAKKAKTQPPAAKAETSVPKAPPAPKAPPPPISPAVSPQPIIQRPYIGPVVESLRHRNAPDIDRKGSGSAVQRDTAEDAAAARQGAEAGEGQAKADAAAQGGGAGAAGEQDSYARSVFRRIRRHQSYGAALARDGLTGTAIVELAIGRRGELKEARIVRSSGHDRIDRIALRQVQEAAPFPRPPEGRPRRFRIPMTYRPRD